MSAEALAALYIQMDDDEAVRRSLAAGDFAGADLDDTEQALLRAAASEELPEVIPFSSKLILPARFAAIDHIGKHLSSPTSQASWLANFDQRQLSHIAPGM